MKISFLKHNLKSRFMDGFSLGYHLILPVCLTLLLAFITKNIYPSEMNSYQYYTITIVLYCTLLSMITAAYAGKEDAYHNTAVRLLASPISDACIVISKIISSTITYFLCSIIAFLSFLVSVIFT